MSTGELIGTIASVFGFTCKSGLPALIWLTLVFAFFIRFEKALDRMECGKDEYNCLEDDEQWEDREQPSQPEARRYY